MKKKKKAQRAWKRSGKFNRHHIINKCRGGSASVENLLVMDTRRHEAWHLLFGNDSFEQVIALLKRTLEMKHIEHKCRFDNQTYLEFPDM